MRFLSVCTSLIGLASLSRYVAASLRITTDHHSFGGVNYPALQTLNDVERDEVIRGIVKSGARVIRLFSKYSPRILGGCCEVWGTSIELDLY